MWFQPYLTSSKFIFVVIMFKAKSNLHTIRSTSAKIFVVALQHKYVIVVLPSQTGLTKLWGIVVWQKSTSCLVKTLLAARWTTGLHEKSRWMRLQLVAHSFLTAWLHLTVPGRQRVYFYVACKEWVYEFGIENKCHSVLIKYEWWDELTSWHGCRPRRAACVTVTDRMQFTSQHGAEN